MTPTDRKLATLAIDPKGSWRRHRFEFCNALEAALDTGSDKAWNELRGMGVEVVEAQSIQAIEDRDMFKGAK